MKYIRTKSGIKTQYDTVRPCNVVEKADTIEELCDEFVGIDSQGHFIIHNDKWLEGARIVPLEEIKYYGAIWTDKGLIYVAKMNDKKELELL